MTTIKICMTMLLAACILSGCSSNNNSSGEVDQIKNEMLALKEENNKLKKELATLQEKETDVIETPAAIVEEPAPSVVNQLIAEKNKPIEIADFAEMTIINHQFAKTIKPSKPGSFYTYYEAKEPDTTYLAISIKIKSLLTSAKGADEFADVSIKYNDKYDYNTFSTIEDKGGEDFTYTNITNIEPLKFGTLVFIAEVPAEMEKGDQPVTALITFNDSTYEYKIR
jgi:hypothetical protein